MRGIWTAIITPFQDNGEIDYNSFKRILNDQVNAGITGVVPCGTTGESPTLSLEEKRNLIQFTLKELKGTGVKVIAGTGSNSTSESVELSKWASSQGVDGVLVVTPYYNKPSQSGLENHFLSIASAVNCEVVLYNVPSRTGISLTAETVSKLAGHPKIRTLKEATGNVTFSSEILDQLSRDGRSLDILAGDDGTFLPLLSIGAVGIISVASNLFPRAMIAIQKSFEEGNLVRAREIHQHYFPLFRDLFIETNPVPIKAAMSNLGWCTPKVRSPLAPLASNHFTKLQLSLNHCKITPGAS